ncbi:MAG: methyltransferase, TIGR04325 family, partial [Endomicrobiia bacterium]|nr:methyltransferase, TIGR04325 family [Endomicrobiia bacterium]
SAYKKIARGRPALFSGIYNNVEGVKNQNPWIREPWIELSKKKLSDLMNNCFNAGEANLPDLAGYPVLPNLIINTFPIKSNCSIMDFGGGTGFVYFKIFPYLANPSGVQWHVVDNNPRIFEIGKKYAANSKNTFHIFFHETIPAIEKIKIDVLYINVSLQYIPDYRSVLNNLILYGPKYVILTRLYAGDVDTWISSQNIHGYTTYCIFINTKEIMEIFSENGYDLIHKSSVEDEGIEGRYDPNIPQHLRISNSINLIFKKDHL